MMNWMDQHAIVLLFLLPLMGVAYVGCVPRTDVASMRQLAIGVLVAVLLLGTRIAYLLLTAGVLFTWTLNVPLLLPLGNFTAFALSLTELCLMIPVWAVALLVLVFKKAEVESMGVVFIVTLLSIVAILLLCITSVSYLHIICWAVVLNALVGMLWALYGNTRKGSAILRSCVFFLLVDVVGITAFLPGMLALMVLPGLARLMLSVVYPLQWYWFSGVVLVMVGAKICQQCNML